jgi:hypothetical protein
MNFTLVAGAISGAVFMGCLAWIFEVGQTPIFPLIGIVLSAFVFGALLSEGNQ